MPYLLWQNGCRISFTDKLLAGNPQTGNANNFGPLRDGYNTTQFLRDAVDLARGHPVHLHFHRRGHEGLLTPLVAGERRGLETAPGPGAPGAASVRRGSPEIGDGSRCGGPSGLGVRL